VNIFKIILIYVKKSKVDLELLLIFGPLSKKLSLMIRITIFVTF